MVGQFVHRDMRHQRLQRHVAPLAPFSRIARRNSHIVSGPIGWSMIDFSVIGCPFIEAGQL